MRTRPSRAWVRMASCLWRPGYYTGQWRSGVALRWSPVNVAAAIFTGLVVSVVVVQRVTGADWSAWLRPAGSIVPIVLLVLGRHECARRRAWATVRELRRADSPWITGDGQYRLNWLGLLQGTLATSNWVWAGVITLQGAVVIDTLGLGDVLGIAAFAGAVMFVTGWATTKLWTQRFLERVQRGACPACGHAGGNAAARCPTCGEPTWFVRRLQKPRARMHAPLPSVGGHSAAAGA